MKRIALGLLLSAALFSPALALDDGCISVPNFNPLVSAGKTIRICNYSATTAYDFRLPSTLGVVNTPILSGGAGADLVPSPGTLVLGSGVALTVNRTMTLTGGADGYILNMGGNITTGGTITTGASVNFTVNRTMTLTGLADGYVLTMGGNLTTAAAFTQSGTGPVTITTTGTTNSTLPLGTHTLVPSDSPTFTGTVTIPSPFTLGGVSMTTTAAKLNFLANAAGTTGTTSTNIVFSTSPALTTPDIGAATGTSLTGSGGSLTLSSGGTGALSLNTTGGTQFQITNTASANNFIQATGSNGGNVFLAATGGGTNIGFVFRQKGNESVYFQDASGNTLMSVAYTANAVNRMDLYPAATGNPPEIFVVGSDTNIDLKLTPKGTGVLRTGSFVPNGTVATDMSALGPTGSHITIQEWLAVKNSSGTIRYLPAF